MEAIEEAKKFIGFLDLEPKFSIDEQPFDSKVVVLVDPYKGNYRLNVGLYEESDPLKGYQPLDVSVWAVRTRVQVQNSELELFPCVGVDRAGFVRPRLEKFNPEEGSLAVIDARILTLLSYKLWAKNQNFLPLIKTLLPLDAHQIIERTKKFFPEGL
ncbi:MAG: hypothetical protein PHO90_03065 [Candidatus Pacebacteria bacterium]|nr:hypothetical protein [Candidatus Paceibacterota bacterium]